MIYLFVLAHLLADFVLQPFWLVQRKRRWDGLLIHGGIVLTCMLALLTSAPQTQALWPAMLVIALVHTTADWWKVQRGNRLFRHPILPFLLDQTVHLTTIGVVLSLLVPGEQLWDAHLSPLSLTSVYVSGYIVAGFAAPIAVMIWLDPTFAAVVRAQAARLRSGLLGVAALSLALTCGALALPLTLTGLLWVARYPTAAHPLDTRRGRLLVVWLGALLGVLLGHYG